jgi:hypothetical protein
MPVYKTAKRFMQHLFSPGVSDTPQISRNHDWKIASGSFTTVPCPPPDIHIFYVFLEN